MDAAASTFSTPTAIHPDRPKLSVVVPVGGLRERSERSIQAILDQELDGELELIIVDTRPEFPRVKGHDAPNVVYVEFPQTISYAECKLCGMRHASHEYVAFVEDHAFVQPGWAKGVMKGFATGADVVVYTYLDATPQSFFSRTFMLLSYGPWMDERLAGERHNGPGNNIAYRKSTLLRYGEQLDIMMGSELFLHRAIRKEGGKVYQEATAKLAHSNWWDLRGTLHDTCSCSHLFGRQRTLIEHLSFPRRLFYAACMPIVPALVLWRYFKMLKPAPELRARFVRCSPMVFFYSCCSVAFEAAGYLSNQSKLKWHFDVEVNVPRACDPQGTPSMVVKDPPGGSTEPPTGVRA